MNSPKFIIFSYDYPPCNGGIARLCGEIRKELMRRGYTVEVITCVAGEQEQGVTRMPLRRGLLEMKMVAALKRCYQKGDIVITDTWHPCGMLSMLCGCTTFMLAHGAEILPSHGYANTWLWKSYRRKVLAKATGVVANSHYTADLVKRCSPKSNCIAIPLAIDADYFHPTASKNMQDNVLRICSLSRLQKYKGHDFIIRTIASLPDDYKRRLRFEIGGKGAYKSELEKLSAGLGLNDGTVEFLGFMPDSEVLNFYSRNDLFILCTREEHTAGNVEGFGLVFTEAQACGTAAIGTRTGGIPDAICDGEGGWLIEQDNEDQLRKLLMYAIDNKSLIQQQGEVARQRVIRDCNWQIYGSNLLDFINKTIKR